MRFYPGVKRRCSLISLSMGSEDVEVPTTETVATATDPLLDELKAVHQDVIACRDILTILLAAFVVYAVIRLSLGWWMHGR